DAQRTDGTSIGDTDVLRWVAPPILWGYQSLIATAIKRFKEFVKLVGTDDRRVLVKDPDKYFDSGA
ncbi:hypothetical protein LTR28_000637, partial [Elasticomyces elasticus]